ncbi:DUF3179 domain-containing protein [candidate division KSB1 bacterium]|nr:DUF3179 domain-containing protein [candidate division KSB1 bacterium]
MYDRVYGNKEINFEASGGLMNASLVMQDFETDSYWAIMRGESIAGEFKGTKLKELPFGKKAMWKDWVKEHPNTVVLSVNGQEDGRDGYQRYFSSPEGFRGSVAKDTRLRTKEPIFAFHWQEQSFAIPHSAVEGGKAFDLGEIKLFLYRPKGAAIFHSTTVYQSASSSFKNVDGIWIHDKSGCKFNLENERFEGNEAACPQRFEGFDTFWYNWSLNNPETKLLQ